MLKSAKEIKEEYKITSQTLYNWRKIGKIKYKEINSRNFLYDVSDIEGVQSSKRSNVIYARVSNTKQSEDLERQELFIREYMISNGVIVDFVYKDIASGMNEERKSFNKLVKSVINQEIDTIYISYKDRLTRFGYGYIENWFSQFGTKIIVLNSTKEEDFQQELTEDLISIIHHFSMKMYSNRRKMLKQTEENLKNEVI